MARWTRLFCAAAIIALPGQGLAQPATGAARNVPSAEVFPPPGGPVIYKSATDLDAVLKTQTAASNTIAVSLVQLTDRTSLNIVRRGEANGPIAHRGWTEVHYIVDGGGVAEVGGKIAEGAAGGGNNATVTGAAQKHVKKGDIVIIPANSLHHYKDLEGFITYYEIRFPNAPAVVAPAAGGSLPPAPVPESQGIFISGEDLSAALAKSEKANSAEGVAPVMVTERFSINEVKRSKAAGALTHNGWNEMHYILAGNATVVTGGKLAGTGRDRTIQDGVTQAVKPGDVLIVPDNTPHQYAAVAPSVTYLEVRFPDVAGERSGRRGQ